MRYEEATMLLRMIRCNAEEAVLPGLDLALGVLDMVEGTANASGKTAEKPKKSEPKKKPEKKAAAKKKPKYKPKKCERCGKEFVPRWAAQRKCDKCKDEENKVKDAAYEIASMEG